MAYLQSGTDLLLSPPALRFVLLVDEQPVPPTVAPIVLSPAAGGTSLGLTAMPSLAAGPHRVQVVGVAVGGAAYTIRNQALTTMAAPQ